MTVWEGFGFVAESRKWLDAAFQMGSNRKLRVLRLFIFNKSKLTRRIQTLMKLWYPRFLLTFFQDEGSCSANRTGGGLGCAEKGEHFST